MRKIQIRDHAARREDWVAEPWKKAHVIPVDLENAAG